MIDIDVSAALTQAKKELEEEEFRKVVEKFKDRLRKQRTFWDRLFPFKIIIIRKERL